MKHVFAILSLILTVNTYAAVEFFDGTFPSGEYAATKITDTTPGAAATFTAGQVLTSGNPDAFRLIDMSNVNPTGGIAVAHLWTVAVYDPAVDGPVGGIRAEFAGRFIGGSFGTSQYGYHLFFEQAGNRYVASNLVWFAVAHGPGNGAAGSWTNFTFPTLAPTQFRWQSGLGDTPPDLSATGAPITFGFFTTTAASTIPVSITGGVDNVRFTVLATNDSDVAVSQIATPTVAVVNAGLSYAITVTNAGVVDATGVLVTDALPAGATFISATPNQGTCTQIAGIVTCDLGNLNAGNSASINLAVLPTATGSLSNQVSLTADQPDPFPDNNTATIVTTVLPDGTDLTAELAAEFGDCADTKKGLACAITAQLLLQNNGLVYGDAMLILTNVCTTTKLPAKCKLSGTLVVTELDLTGLPDHNLAFYLSSDMTLDAGDFLMKSVGLSKAISAFLKGKAVKLSLKLPKGVDLAGQHILVVVDAPDKKGFDAVAETDETNNAAASPALPALP